MSDSQTNYVGRGANLQTANRFERLHLELDYEQLDEQEQSELLTKKVATEYFVDHSQSVVSENDSPDLSFRYSINPYRGCAHGCSYCYARPYHEFLGLSAGLDFESKIFVKPNAPELFRKWLSRKNWQCEPVNLSGITDPYQPVERQLRITRGCLEVAEQCGQPIYLITKNAMITRDVDLLSAMAEKRLMSVIISITSLDQSLIRVMEPRTSSPESRIETVRQLSDHGIDVMVNVSPIIPGLTDIEVPQILSRVAEVGAKAASYTVLRLPGAVESIFRDWLARHQPLKLAKVESLIKATRGGKLSETQFFDRMKGTGAIAEHIRQTMKTFSRKLGLASRLQPLDTSQFAHPEANHRQGRLFD